LGQSLAKRSEASELQTRIALAVKTADESELAPLRDFAEKTSVLKDGLQTLVVSSPAQADCEEEVAEAVSANLQEIYKHLKRRLASSEWKKVRDIIQSVTGEEPN
jgi:hypothetical protein